MKLGSVAELLKILVLRQFTKKDIQVAFKLMKRRLASVRKKNENLNSLRYHFSPIMKNLTLN